MTGSTNDYAPHPHIGGRVAVLRALAAWRMEWPGTPRVIVLTGDSGSGRSHLLTGFLMMCDPEFRKRLPLDEMDPSTVPPELPAPAVPSAEGLTAAQVLWLLAEHYQLRATSTADVYAELAALDQPVTVVVPDVDRAGPVRAAGEPGRLVREVLKPLAATGTVRLLVDVPRPLAAELADGLPYGSVQIIDLDAPEWADPEGLVRHAEAALSPQSGAPELPFTTDAAARHALATAIGRRAGTSPLVVQLAVLGILTAPDSFDPADQQHLQYLPGSVGEALDLHARRLGADPQTLRLMLAPLALAEGEGLPVEMLARLSGAIAGRDMSETLAGAMTVVGPFVQPKETDGDDGPRTLLRLLHPAIGDEIRAGLPNLRAAQAHMAMALLEAVPGQDWSKADPYVRDHIAGHTLEAGLLPQLLTDPGLFVYADPVALRAAVEAVPLEALGAPARTYLRTAPLLTRTEAPARMRAALLETAFVEDGLPEYADGVHRLGIGLPWQTLWSLPVPGIRDVTVGILHYGAEEPVTPVAVLVVPAGTPGSRPVGESADAAKAGRPGESAVLVHGLVQPARLGEADPRQVQRLSEDERAAAPLALSRGVDYLRVWDRASEEVVAALISDTPFTGAALSPDGILVAATERGVKALRIRHPASATS